MTDAGQTKAARRLAELQSQGFGGVILARELEEAVLVSSDADLIPTVAVLPVGRRGALHRSLH